MATEKFLLKVIFSEFQDYFSVDLFSHFQVLISWFFFSEYLLAFQKELEAEIRKEMAKFYANMKDEMIEAFKKMDEDGNGFLSKEEIQKVLEENCEKWGYFDEDMFNKLDENDDGKISTDGIFFLYFFSEKFLIFFLLFQSFWRGLWLIAKGMRNARLPTIEQKMKTKKYDLIFKFKNIFLEK